MMSRMKRILAMALAVMIVVPMAGSVTGYAATTPKITSQPSTTWTAGSVVKDFEIEVQDVQNGTGLKKEDIYINDSSKLKIAAGCDFEQNTGKLTITKFIDEAGQTTDTVKYIVKAEGLKHKAASTGATLTFTVDYKTHGAQAPVTVTVPKMSGGSGGGTATPPEDTSANARYTLQKVSSPKNGSGTPLPASPPRYDIDNITSSSDATIRQNYFVDISVKFSDANLPIGASGVLTAADIDTDDLGSFVFDSSSTVEIFTPSAGYCEIIFKGIRYTGNAKKLSFRIDNGSYGKDVIASLSECVTRLEANAGNESSKPDDDDPSIESETPYVIVNQYGYGGGTVTAGETFNLSLTFLNTSDTIDVSNMMITVTMPTDLMLTSSSNTFYVPLLETKKSITKSVQVTAKADAKAQSHNIGVSMKYQYIDHRVNARRSAETTENIAIPVVQVDRFQITAVEIPMDIMMEEETSITVSFVNKGRSEAYNLTASIDGNILNPGQNQNLGNLASGVAGTADFFIKPSEAGQLGGTIQITYEDTNMEEKVATIPYNATVKTMEEMNGGGMGGMFPGEAIPGEGEVVPEDNKPKWPIILIVGVAVLIPVGIIVKKVIDKKRKEREDADL